MFPSLLKIPVLSINNWILDVEDNITKSDLTVEEQIPLLIATMMGETAYSYWNTDVDAAPASQKWTAYYQSNTAYNYANIPYWVAAAIEGALVGYGSSMDGNLEPTTAMVSNKMIAGLAGALAVNIALVTLQIIPRIQPIQVTPLQLNAQTIANLLGNDQHAPHKSVGPFCHNNPNPASDQGCTISGFNQTICANATDALMCLIA